LVNSPFVLYRGLPIQKWYIKKNWFIAGHSNNICTKQIYDKEDNYSENIENNNFDHENIAMMCDSNFYYPENIFIP